MKHLRLILVLMLAVTLSACDLGGGQGNVQQPQQPSLAEMQATAMAQAEANLALTQASIPTDTPVPPTPTVPLPTIPPMTLPPIVSATPTLGLAGGANNEATTAAQGCDQDSYNPSTVDETIPDGTVINIGQSFTKEWLIYNSGTCTWDTTYSFVFTGGDQMGAPASIPLTASVAPGHSLQISIPMTADSSPIPETAGNWRMQNGNGDQFGTYLTVKIQVVNPNTATPTSITATPTTIVIGLTNTPTSTATATPTP